MRRVLRHPAEMTNEELEILAEIDMDEQIVKKVVDNEKMCKDPPFLLQIFYSRCEY